VEPGPDHKGGERAGRYVKRERLGAGGMGEVWKAWDTDLSRWVALKFLKNASPEDVARFKREAQISAQLSNPNIAAVYEANDAFIAMQYIDGHVLRPGAAPAVAGWIRDAALATHAAHERGIVHRDLKPSNLMLDGTGRLFVMDFGLARRRDVRSSLSVSGMMVGTPAYMSPEQVRGIEADARSDVYGLGATLYELLTGSAPFRETDLLSLLVRVAEEEPAPPRGVDPDLAAVVMKCLEKTPAGRYATARELAEDLQRWLAGEPVAARPPSFVGRMRRRLARRKMLVTAALAAAGLATLLLAPPLVAARRRETAMRELGALWMNVVVARQGYHSAGQDPGRVRAMLERAVVALGGFIERHESRPEGWYVRARARMALDDLDGAEQDLNRAVGCDPRFAPAYALLGRLHLERHARAVYDRGSSGRATDLARLAGQALSRAGSPDLAEWGFARTPDDEAADVLTHAFMEAYVHRDVAAAVRRLREAQAAAPSEEFAVWLAHWSTTDDERMRWCNEALKLRPHFPRALLDRGLLRRRQGDVDGAIADCTDALRVAPGLAEAHLNRANARQDRGDLDAAIADCTEAIRINPRLLWAYTNRGFIRGDGGDHAGCIADCDLALAIDAGFAPAHVGRGIAYHSLGRLDDAMNEYARAIALDPRCANAYVNRSGVLIDRGRHDEALADCDEALRIDPSAAKAHCNRGLVHRDRGDLDAAVADFTRALDANPQYVEAYDARGCAHLARGRPDAALADFDAALRIRPGDPGTRTNRGVLHFEQGRIDQALTDYDAAIAADPRFYEARFNRGIARARLHRFRDAISDFDACVGARPGAPDAWCNRGIVKGLSGDRAGAVADLERALEVAPDRWPGRARAEETLRRARGP